MTGATRSASRRHRRGLLVAAVVLAVIALLVGWQVAQRRDSVHVGDRFADVTVYSDQLGENNASVQLPFGALRLTIGIGAEVDELRHRVQAPAGAALVEVSWSAGTTTGVPPVWPTATAAQRRDPGSTLTLVSDGRRYPIAQAVTMADDGGSVLVVVKGDGTDARVEARFDGRVEQSQPADAMPPKVQTDGFRSCDDTSDKVFSWVKCTVPVYRGGYVPGLGAAPAGKEWLVVHDASVTRSDRRVSVYDAKDRGARYLPSGKPSVGVSLDGVKSSPRKAGEDVTVGDSVRVASRAWLVPTDLTATVRLRYQLPTALDETQTDQPRGPKTHQVDVGTTVVLQGSDPSAR